MIHRGIDDFVLFFNQNLFFEYILIFVVFLVSFILKDNLFGKDICRESNTKKHHEGNNQA